MNKIKFLIQTIQKIKNWYIIPLVYFGLYNKEYFLLEFRNGLKCKLRTKETDIHAFANVWLVQEYKNIGFKIDENIPIIDVGAHIGLFALYASQFCKKEKILCFEPVRENFQLLQENIKMNKFTNILLYNKAVSAKDEKIKIFLDANDSAAHTIFEKNHGFQEIESVSIQTIIEENNLEECNIKLDCEGAEFEILQNLSKNDIKKIKKICFEYHIMNKNYENLNSLKISLKDDFKLIENKTSTDLGIIYASK